MVELLRYHIYIGWIEKEIGTENHSKNKSGGIFAMSIKKLYSNELLASFEYSNIDKDYDFYYVTTSDKYIKGGATFLDIDDIKISALQFESGKSFLGYAS